MSMNRDRATISRQSGPIYANSYALKGLGVRYTEPFPIPGPVVLPVAWRMPQLPPVDKFRFDFTKEREVLEQAAIRRRAIVGEAGNQQPVRPDVYSRVESFPLSSSIPLIPYLSSAVLTPTRVPSSEAGDTSQTTSIAQGTNGASSSTAPASATQQSLTQPLGELSLKDFEGAADPFEMTTLQAIDVIAELQDVLQPSSTVPTSATPSIATSQTPSVAQPNTSPTTHLRSVQPVAPSGSPTPPTPRANRVEIAPTTSGYAPPTVGYPTAGYTPPITSSYAPPPNTVGYPQLIDIGPPVAAASSSPAQPKPQVSPPPPRPPKPRVSFNVPPVPARDTVTTDPVPPPPQQHQRQPFAGVPVLPSMSSPATQQRQPFAGGVSVLPPIPSQQQPPVTPPPYQQHPPSSEPVLPPYPADSEPYLPPYPSDELSSYRQQEDENLYGSRPYRLPDVQVSPDMKESLRNISGMGFPSPRVARALKRCEGDSQKVFDFLLLVGELVDKGFNGDSAEMALLSHDEKIDKSVDYLNQVERYKELWSETSIHDAYKQAGKDWDKAVDILTQGTS